MGDPAARSPDLLATLDRLAASMERAAAGEPEGLPPAAAAAYLGISVAKLHQMNAAGLLPAPAELGDRCPRWARSELRAWLLAGSPSRVRWRSMRDGQLRRLAS